MDSSPQHSIGQAVVVSKERPIPAIRRPSLLPAFEPLSSSPGGLPRASKRKFDEHHNDEDRKYYPTPVPTSSTGMLPSSPNMHPLMQRHVSSLSERAPLGAVPSLDLPSTGEPVLMGRSSNSSDYQLSANRLISRVHVRATYHAPTEDRPKARVEVQCLGWNGCKVHYQGQAVELAKGEKFVSDKPAAQIMVDVQETRVFLVWPRREVLRSPSAEHSAKEDSLVNDCFVSSPPMIDPRMHSPTSPSPANRSIIEASTFASTFRADQSFDGADETAVQVYEDDDSVDEVLPLSQTPLPLSQGARTPVPISRGSPAPSKSSTPSKPSHELASSSLSEPGELSEHDEENDPVVHSFGPFGENLLSRFESIQPSSPEGPLKSLKSSHASPMNLSDASTPRSFRQSPVKNHVVNQLAFSRVHSVPLSTIYNNLPPDMKGPKVFLQPGTTQTLTSEELKSLLFNIPCVGEISREGKDAAGKALENEFYYVPELDDDEPRRTAVSVSKPPLRGVRKQHKQYYWKRPRH